MPESTKSPSAQNSLSNGLAIAYKAYARAIPFPGDGHTGALFLIATCYYQSSGFTIYFEENSGEWSLMEEPPTGIVHFLDTCYVASGTSGIELASPPAHVTITDGQGKHVVPVERW